MPINRPDSFQSLGTAIVNGGETQQITNVAGGPGIDVFNYKAPLNRPFQNVGDPVVAFSLRKVGDENKCINVQAGNNPATDIGFAPNAQGILALDEEQLLDYARQYPTSEIRVNKIYDQSGNDNHLVSDTGGARFKAVTDENSGGLPQRLFKDSSGNPYLEGTGSDDFYNLSVGGISISENFSALLVSAGGFVSTTRFFGGPSLGNMGFTFSGNDTIQFNNGPVVSTASFTAGGTRLNQNIFWFNSENNGDAVRAYQNNVASPDNPIDQTSYTYPRSIAQGTATTGSPTNGNIAFPSGGNWQELIFWNNDSNADQKEEIYNQTNYYYRTQPNVPDASLVIKQPGLVRGNSTVLSQANLGTTAGSYGRHSIIFKDWPYGTQTSLLEGRIVFWNATSGIWELTSSSSFNATLLLGMTTGSSVASQNTVLKRGFIRTDRDFSTFAIGQPLYLGINGQIIGVKPTSANNFVRLVGWAMDKDPTNGLLFFSPDVNFETVA